MVKVKNVKKFKKYNMRVVGNAILLICNENDSLEKIQEYKDHELITDIYDIGKHLNEEINKYCVREEKRIKKINYSAMEFEAMDQDTKNRKVIELFKSICSNDFKEDIICNHFNNDNNDDDISDSSNDLYVDINIDKYVAFYDIFKNCYLLFKEHKIDTSELSTPDEIQELIRYDKYGISDIDFKFREAQTKLSLNYKTLIDLLEQNINYLDYSKLLNSVNYIPLNIKHLFGKIIENKSTSESSKNIFNLIKTFCEKYGLPYWKTEIYSRKEVEIPLNNFILICLAVYIYAELWNNILQYDDSSYEWDDYIYSFRVLGISFEYDEKANSIIKKIVKSIEDFDFYITNTCDKLLNHKLNTYRKKVLDKSSSTLENETIYDSIIIAVWNIFYLYYFGSSKKLKPAVYKTCEECHKNIRGKSHTLRDGSKKIICDCCYKARRRHLNNISVNKCRSHK